MRRILNICIYNNVRYSSLITMNNHYRERALCLTDQKHHIIKYKHVYWIYIKDDINSDILLQTAAIYFSIEPVSKTGYWLGVWHGLFHLQGLTGDMRIASRARITKWKILAHSRIWTEDLLTKRTQGLMSLEWMKVHLVLPVLFLEIYQ